MLSVIYKPFLLSVVMLSVMAPSRDGIIGIGDLIANKFCLCIQTLIGTLSSQVR
jgi:hypothetical protein